ncbi:MAG: hypothetical protein QOF30_1894 [Acidimicrobiaceae bacterium]|jgi:hypothetical protein|nr:hypothetical protein [Acidimicrobiaceae bacterium]
MGDSVISDFYLAFAPLSFTVLGLWFIVVQTRHAEWSVSREHRSRASIVALQFALPGLMSLLAVVNPTSKAMWRTSFTVTALVGAAALLALTVGHGRRAPLLTAGHALSVLLFAAVALFALWPSLVGDMGMNAQPLQVEATLLSLLMFTGVAVAWMLLFDTTPVTTPDRAAGVPRS